MESKNSLTEWGFVPGDDWPEDRDKQEGEALLEAHVDELFHHLKLL